ncbi:MAG: 3-deoxy-manno-octulosonate cytidylyltransferase [Chlamydiae bacterium]|nr:3-deoxy-manno-octulosonate cytidylyltransferase [Chlamydiota bacterium]
MTQAQVIGIIPARYGSRRFPGKPLASIAGKSLIQRTYENAKKCSLFNHLIVATEDQRIYDHVLEFQGEVVMTSPDSPTGTERVVEALSQIQAPDDAIIVNIQGDVPLLETLVIEEVVNLLIQNEQEVMSTAVVPITQEAEALDPHIVKCILDKTNHALYFSRGLIPCGEFRQDVVYYHHLGIYAYRKEFVRHYMTLDPTPLQMAEDLEQLKVLEHGFRIKVAIVESTSFGVDRPQDIKRVEDNL